MAHSDRHLNLVPPAASENAGRGADDPAGPSAPPRDQLPPAQNVVVSGQSGSCSYTISTHGTTDFELVVSGMDQSPLAEAAAASEKAILAALGERSQSHLSSVRFGLWGSDRGRALRERIQNTGAERPVPRHLPDGLEGTSYIRDHRVHDGLSADRRRPQLLRRRWLGTLGLRLGGPWRVW